METTETSWTEALDSVKVDFGQTDRHDGPLQHERLRRDTGMLIARNDGIAASSRPYTLQTPSPSPESSDPDTPGPREPGPDSAGKNGPRPSNSPRPSSTSPTPSTPTSEAACDAASADPTYTISLRGGPQSRRPCPPPAGTTALPPDQSLIPTATDLPETVTINLSQQFNGQDVNAGPTATRGIRPPKSLYTPSSLHVRCDSCSTNGSMIITQGGWNVSADDFSSGHIDIALADFNAYIKLWIDGLDGTGSMSRELVGDVPIPGFGRAGLLVRPELFVEWDLAAGAAAVLLNALGFQLRVPPGARVAVDFANAANSRVAVPFVEPYYDSLNLTIADERLATACYAFDADGRELLVNATERVAEIGRELALKAQVEGGKGEGSGGEGEGSGGEGEGKKGGVAAPALSLLVSLATGCLLVVASGFSCL